MKACRLLQVFSVLSGLSLGTLGFYGCEKTLQHTPPRPQQQGPEARSDFTWSGLGFGIEMTMELHSVTEQQAATLSTETEKILQQLEQSFSLYLAQSELSVLNRERVLLNPSRQFLHLLETAQILHQRTLGYYQPAIHGAWSALDTRATEPRQWQAQCAAASLEYLTLSEKQIELTHPLTQLSFNAIVQGYLADLVKDRVQRAGVHSALLYLGETYAVGQHPDGRPWELAVMGTPVNGAADLVGTVRLSNAGLAVSAHDASRQLLNPTSWDVLQSDRVVAIVSDQGATVADAFATAFAVAPQSDWPALHTALLKGGQCQVKIWIANQLVMER